MPFLSFHTSPKHTKSPDTRRDSLRRHYCCPSYPFLWFRPPHLILGRLTVGLTLIKIIFFSCGIGVIFSPIPNSFQKFIPLLFLVQHFFSCFSLFSLLLSIPSKHLLCPKKIPIPIFQSVSPIPNHHQPTSFICWHKDNASG